MVDLTPRHMYLFCKEIYLCTNVSFYNVPTYSLSIYNLYKKDIDINYNIR